MLSKTGSRKTHTGSYLDSLFVLASHRTTTPSGIQMGVFGSANLGIIHLKPPLPDCGVVTIRGCQVAATGRAGGSRAVLCDIGSSPSEHHF